MKWPVLWVYILGMTACGSSGSTGDTGSGTASKGDSNNSGQGVGVDISPSADTSYQPLKSGSRLTAIQLTGSDGSSYQTGTFYDTSLKTDCSVVMASDGTMRCLPALSSNYHYFVDDACADTAVVVASQQMTSSGCITPSQNAFYTQYAIFGNLCGGANVYKLGASIDASSTLYEVNAEGNCVQLGSLNAVFGSAYLGFAGGAQVGLSAFAEFTF